MFQPETEEWTEGVYQIEIDDDVLGGPDGPDNKPLLDLACRTSYLRQMIGEVADIRG